MSTPLTPIERIDRAIGEFTKAADRPNISTTERDSLLQCAAYLGVEFRSFASTSPTRAVIKEDTGEVSP